MKKVIVLLAISMASSAAFAQETCYQVSSNGTAWSRTPENLCVAETGEGAYSITLKSGSPFLGQEQEIAKFNLTLLQQARSMDSNANVFGIANPSNSTFNALKIRFDGKIDMNTGAESGTVFIGQTKLFYRLK